MAARGRKLTLAHPPWSHTSQRPLCRITPALQPRRRQAEVQILIPRDARSRTHCSLLIQTVSEAQWARVGQDLLDVRHALRLLPFATRVGPAGRDLLVLGPDRVMLFVIDDDPVHGRVFFVVCRHSVSSLSGLRRWPAGGCTSSYVAPGPRCPAPDEICM